MVHYVGYFGDPGRAGPTLDSSVPNRASNLTNKRAVRRTQLGYVEETCATPLVNKQCMHTYMYVYIVYLYSHGHAYAHMYMYIQIDLFAYVHILLIG